MIRRLQMKLIRITMISLAMVLGVVIAAANLLNYRELITDADLTLSILAENQGTFPESMDQCEQRDFLQSPELSYETRFFYVVLDEDGNILSSSTGQIAAVDDETVAEYAQEIWARGKEKGFSGDYRYLVYKTNSGYYVMLLDCMRSLSNARRFLFLSVWASMGGLVIVFLLLLSVSGKIVKPFSESYEKQKRFITDAGHELKTPLAVIAADSEVLEMDLGRNEWIADIRKQTEHLTELTNDLIVLSRMDEQDENVQTEEIPLSELAEEALDSFRMLASAQNKSIESDIEPGLKMQGNEKAIRRLFSILLDNAIKYSEENGRIRLSLGKQRKQIRLSIYNTAHEVRKECLPHLFDRFYRADQSRNSCGYGLGLSIAASTVAAHKGKITASTEDGRSLTITAVFPV